MESSLLNGMCRCCASEGVFKDVKTAYTWMGEEEVYADMLKQCFDICLSTSEQGDDGGICEVCITQLRNAANFKKQVLTTEEQFKKHALSKLFKPSIIKLEVSPEDDNDSDDNALSGDDGYSGPEFEVPIKTEVDDPKPKKRAAASKASTSRAKKAKADNGETSTKRKQIIKEENQTAIETTKPRSKITEEVKRRNEIKQNEHNILQILSYTNSTLIDRKDDTGYYCYYCNTNYKDPAILKQHTLETHSNEGKTKKYFEKTKNKRLQPAKLDITGLICNICNKNIDSLEKCFNHLNNDHKKIIHIDVKNLILPFKFETEKLFCCICSNSYHNFRTLLVHMHVHYRNYICEICDAGFVTESTLATHSFIHKTCNLKCNTCSKVFETVSRRQYHEKTKHRDKLLLYKCGYCIERFDDYYKKNRHLSTVHGINKSINCGACDKVFKCKKSLGVHMKKHHLMQRDFKCPDCDRFFCTNSQLKLHMVMHSGVKKFECDLCSKLFARKHTLVEHIRIHNNDRRFKCEVCGQAFIQKCSWRAHMQNKHGESTS
ncbi:uncharacterized protein LOC142985169 isoform X8 [Anticarsia gemmatalis]|uniref:uncharacterized protein LOC142985169 isoform X8 n=1 Tax=Anticarsia gemmatalis TaxID=129554 RepID=UPI003F7703DC